MAKLVNMRGLQVLCFSLDGQSNWKLCWTHQRALFLQVFISDIRNCSNKEQEQVRVDKELGKIRKKFASGNVLSGAPVNLY